jgi:KaiC/GvpD/RAD55 family RecA-like ATPase
MMIQLLQFWFLFFAIRTSWCERQLRMLSATVSRVLRRWTMNALLATQSVKAKPVGVAHPKRARLAVVILTLERKYWRAAKVPSKRTTSTLRLRRRYP